MKQIRDKTFITAVILVMTACLPTCAANGAPEKLSYADCLERALAANPRLAAAEQAREASLYRKKDTVRLHNPELEMEVENVYGTGPFNGMDDAETTISIGQRLELGGKRSARKELGGIQLTLSGLELVRTRQEVVRLTQERFSRAFHAGQVYSLAQEALDLTIRFVDMVDELVQAGAVPESDYRKAIMARLNARMLLEQAEADHVEAMNRLNALWNSTPEDGTQVIGETNFFHPVSLLPSRYPDNTTLTLILDQQLKQQEAAVRLSRKLRIPDLTVKGGYKRFAGSDEHAFVAGVSIELPVFNTGKWAVATARSELLKRESTVLMQRTDLQSRYRSLYRQNQAAEQMIELLQTEVLPVAKKEVDATIEAYRAGQFSYLQVMDSMHTWIDARRKLLDAKLKRDTFQAELCYLIQTPGDSFMKDGRPIEDR